MKLPTNLTTSSSYAWDIRDYHATIAFPRIQHEGTGREILCFKKLSETTWVRQRKYEKCIL